MHPESDLILPEDRQVEALLAYDEDLAAGRVLSPPIEGDTKLRAVHQCQALLELVWPRSMPGARELPSSLGRFQLERELGRGGFGIVYLATDTKLKRSVALKIPHPGNVLTPEFQHRFLREGEAGSRLDHPHIVPIFEIGEQDRVCYIASAFCDGITLAEWLSRRSTPVPPQVAADVLVKLASAVAHAHERGILHRDLKPKNVMLQGAFGATTDQDAPELSPRICDFGLAKILDQDNNDTCTCVPIGSPAYMAPEQASGQHREISISTDIYALGVILYEILVGRPPFLGESSLETLRHISESDATSPRTLRPGLPRDLDTICMKCLEKRPERRYADASALAADLTRFLEGRPVIARPVSAWTRTGKWVRRRPAVSSLVGFIALGIVAVIGGLAWTGARERDINTKLGEVNTKLGEANNKLGESLDQTRTSERRAQRTLVSGQIRLAQFHFDLGNVETASEILADVRVEPGRPDSRGFAWAYLDRLCRDQLPHAIKLPTPVSQCEITPNGRTVAFGNNQGEIYVWDVATGTIKPLKGRNDGSILALEFSPDRRTLASSSNESIKLWDVDSRELWPDGMLTKEPADWLRFDPDGDALSSVRMRSEKEGHIVSFWKLELRQRQAKFIATEMIQPRSGLLLPKPSFEKDVQDGAHGFPNLVPAVDGRVFAVGQGDGSFRLFDTTSREQFACGRWSGEEVVFVAITQKNELMPGAEAERISGLVQKVTGSKKVLRLFKDVEVRDAVFSPDGASVAVSLPKADGYFTELAVVDVASERPRARYNLAELTANLGSLFRFLSDGRLLIIRSAPSKAVVWQWQGHVDPPSPAGHIQELWSLAYSPDGHTLASSSDDGTIKLWDAANGSLIRTMRSDKLVPSLVSSIAFSPGGKLLASASFDKTVRLWESATGKQLAVLVGHTHNVRSVAFSPDGKVLASAGNDTTVRLWDVSARSAQGEPLKAHSLTVYAVAFSPDGRFLCSGGDDRKICVWEASTGRLLGEYASDNIIQSLTFSPDSTTLATASVDGSITLWDMDTGTPRNRLYGHSLEVYGLAFSPDGSTLATAGRDMTVRLWDSATGQEQLTLKGHKHRVHAVVFSPDGSTLASGSFDGQIKLWRTRVGSD